MREIPTMELNWNLIFVVALGAALFVTLFILLGWLFVVKLYLAMLILVITIFLTDKRIVKTIEEDKQC